MNINPHPPTFTLPSILPPLTATVVFDSIDLLINQAIPAILPVIATGGNDTYTFAVAPALPTGLNFDTATGQITGTPAVLSDATTHTVTVTDQNSPIQTSATFSLTVLPLPALTTTQVIPATTLTANIEATPFTPVTASDGAPAYTFAVAPVLPAGLILSTITGQITGTPTAILTATDFTVTVTDGASQTSSKTFSLTVNAAAAAGQIAYTTAGSYSYTAPAGVTSVSAVCVGGGGGGANYFGSGGAGGGLAYLNNIEVVPGNTYTVVVGAGGAGVPSGNSPTLDPGTITAYNGGTSSFSNGTITVSATGGQHGGGYARVAQPTAGVPAGTFEGGGSGGTSEGNYSSSAPGNSSYMSSSGGGAGGYSGAGGKGAGSLSGSGSYIAATAGTGGGGGGGASMPTNTGSTAYGGSGGGGVGILGEGTSGSSGITDTTAASPDSTMGGGGGSGGSAGSIPPNTNNGGAGGLYGGGGGSGNGDSGTSVGGIGGSGAVRIIWGDGRAFPSTDTGD